MKNDRDDKGHTETMKLPCTTPNGTLQGNPRGLTYQLCVSVCVWYPRHDLTPALWMLFMISKSVNSSEHKSIQTRPTKKQKTSQSWINWIKLSQSCKLTNQQPGKYEVSKQQLFSQKLTELLAFHFVSPPNSHACSLFAKTWMKIDTFLVYTIHVTCL